MSEINTTTIETTLDLKALIDAIRDQQDTLFDAAYLRFKEYVHSYMTNEPMMKNTRKVVMHFDVSQHYMHEALDRLMDDFDESGDFDTDAETVMCGGHELLRVTISLP